MTFAEFKKANNLVVLDLRKVSGFCDFFVIASGNSKPHVRAIADGISDGLREKNKKIRLLHAQGYNEGRWIVLDFLDVIVHVFEEEARSFYDLERLWTAAKKVKLTPQKD